MKKPRCFEKSEDELLIQLVKKYGTDSWTEIASEIEGRTPRQCRNRYNFFLSPEVNNSPWTAEERELLAKKYEEFGPRWALLRTFFPGRTDMNIKNEFGRLARNNSRINLIKQKNTEGNLSTKSTKNTQFLSCLDTIKLMTSRCQYLENLLAQNGIQFEQSELLSQISEKNLADFDVFENNGIQLGHNQKHSDQ